MVHPDDSMIADLDRDTFRELGHRTVDLIADYTAELDDRPVYPAADPADIASAFDEPVPEHGTEPAAIFDEIESTVLPYATHNPSPRYFGFVMGSGTPLSPLAEAIAAAINMNTGGWHPAPSGTEVERCCIRWLAEAIGQP